ncbi:hypothetical protein [Brevundimonas sp.]|uniref:hypothetical protein n=1 Tax=Brevundimonas sp. TaxID=1871086 RepID=UPI002BFC2ADC|nr:hypothetical protein [Brevundimonas sp.]HWQ87319.1 hypothetical protein [Brevundimonas sp.]
MSLVAALLSVALQAAPERETRVPVADLLGQTPGQVAAALGAAPDPVAADAFRIAEGGRAVEIYPAMRFWRVAPAGESCVTGFPEVSDPDNVEGRPRTRLARRNRGYLVFENGRLAGVHPEPLRSGGTDRATRESLEAFGRARSLQSPWLAAPGRLPASDGLGVLDRLPTAPADLSVASLCGPLPNRPPVRSGDIGTDIIWAMIGLPFLVAVPFQRSEAARADREGGALLASVEPGSVLPQDVDAFAAGTKGVRVYRDPADPGFAIVAVKLGPGHSNGSDIGLLGVRGDRVVWETERFPAQVLGLRGLMCRDSGGRAGRVRPGCSTTGFLEP